jgi:hypothetical protein
MKNQDSLKMCRRKQMKKTFILALVATLALTGTAFAAGNHVAAPQATFSFGVGGAAAGPTTTNNDDSCDIGTAPAATLLLPYFEVETATRGVDTFFTVTNVGNLPQIAHVTLWTDWSFPVLDFNLFLTGYDVQAISMYDVIVNGIVAPTNANLTAGGTSSATTPGSVSAANSANPNLIITNCAAGLLPGIIQAPIRGAVQSALVTGIYNFAGFTASCGTTPVGSPASAHRTATTAVGYVTIDVASRCSTTLPNDPSYFANEILFDNVLTGDYETLDKTAGSNYAGGNPLVHIRAVPEGGPAGTPLTGNQTNLPYTFYARFINGQTVGATTYTGTLLNYDRRQPLPSTFAARFIQAGPTSFNTDYKIWREGRTGPVTCATPPSLNSSMPVGEIVRFDEHENPNTFASGQIISPLPSTSISLPETSRNSTAGAVFPPFNSPSGDNGGWMYLNLNSGLTAPTLAANNVNLALHPTFPTPRPSQNWVVVSMTGAGSTAGLFGVEFDATWLGNGCSPAAAASTANGGVVPIGPAGGILVCPAGDSGCTPGAGAYTGTNVTP